MSGFTKLFNSILDSTIWQESNETRLLWITMLAMADKRGDVMASVPGLAKRAGITVSECESGLQVLLSPDPYSRTPDYEGRRIEAVEGGWLLLNHSKYRALLSAEERREYNRRKQAEYRARNKSKGVNDVSITVNHNEQCQHITEAEAEAEADPYAKEEFESTPENSKEGGFKLDSSPPKKEPARKAKPQDRQEFDAFFREIGLAPNDAEATWHKWEGGGWMNGGKKIADWKATVRSWKAAGYFPTQKGTVKPDQWGASSKLPPYHPQIKYPGDTLDAMLASGELDESELTYELDGATKRLKSTKFEMWPDDLQDRVAAFANREAGFQKYQRKA